VGQAQARGRCRERGLGEVDFPLFGVMVWVRSAKLVIIVSHRFWRYKCKLKYFGLRVPIYGTKCALRDIVPHALTARFYNAAGENELGGLAAFALRAVPGWGHAHAQSVRRPIPFANSLEHLTTSLCANCKL